MMESTVMPYPNGSTPSGQSWMSISTAHHKYTTWMSPVLQLAQAKPLEFWSTFAIRRAGRGYKVGKSEYLQSKWWMRPALWVRRSSSSNRSICLRVGFQIMHRLTGALLLARVAGQVTVMATSGLLRCLNRGVGGAYLTPLPGGC